MRKTKTLFMLPAALFLGACVADTTRDFGLDGGDLAALQSGIWIDPNGCDHWIADDGAEGYMTPRLHPDGRPVCRDPQRAAEATTPRLVEVN